MSERKRLVIRLSVAVVCFISALAYLKIATDLRDQAIRNTQSGIDAHIQHLDARLTNAIWQGQRKQLGEELQQVLVSALQRYPLNASWTFQLLQLRHQLGATEQAVLPLLVNAIQLNQWNSGYARALSFYCFYYWGNADNPARQACADFVLQSDAASLNLTSYGVSKEAINNWLSDVQSLKNQVENDGSR